MSQELVSIGMPVYNGERYLEAAIRSNLEQTYPHFELIISDNASTDGTEEICREFAAIDSRIRYSRNLQNIGAARNYNRLFELSRGEYFRWANADDLAAPDLIERTLPVLQSRPDVVIAYGRTSLIDAEGQQIRDYDDRMDLQYERASQRYEEYFRRVGLTNIIYGLMRREAMQKTDLMGNGKIPIADARFMEAMVLLGKFVEVPQVLFYRRMHDRAFSANPEPEKILQFWKASKSPVKFPHWRVHLAGMKAIARAPLSVTEKGALLRFSIRRMVWDRNNLANDIVALFHSQGGKQGSI
jgi:glycosyltransferase involved in cell wall biosynthesis